MNNKNIFSGLFFILFSLTSLTTFAQTNCHDQLSQIQKIDMDIKGIAIPELTYTVDEYNCSQVGPTLKAIEIVEPKLYELLGHYQNYYQECGRNIDIIYFIEDTKINIILMQTLRDLALNLGEQCSNQK